MKESGIKKFTGEANNVNLSIHNNVPFHESKTGIYYTITDDIFFMFPPNIDSGCC